MTRKNPDNKPLRIRHDERYSGPCCVTDESYALMLAQLAVAQSNLVKAGKDSAMPHFIAIVKELERIYGFTFEQVDDGR